MKQIFLKMCILGICTMGVAQTIQGHQTVGVPCIPGVRVLHPFSRETAGANGAAFMVIENRSAEDIVLTSANLQGIHRCDHVELHDVITEKNPQGQEIYKMIPVEKISIPAGASAVLKPKSKHIMFMKLRQRFIKGDTLSVGLVFDKGSCTIPVPILEAGSQGPCGCHKLGGHGADAHAH